jgi:uncharacterized repeat protein (TIGR01451 family)
LRRTTLSRWRRLLAGAVAVPLAATGLLVISSIPAHAATRNFGSVFTANTTGDVMIRGNGLETCPAGSKSAGSSTLTCALVQAGTYSGENNNFDMGYVDVDSNSTTFDSSSATITIPTGATVLFAALTWSGTTAAGSLTGYPGLTGVAAPTPSAEGTVDFATSAAGAYSTVTSTKTDTTGLNYQGYANETTAVAAAGSGVYTVANVQAGTGGNDYAGWALAIAYRDPTQPMRNLDIYTGYTSVSNGTSTSIGLNGFETPLTGPVVTRLGAVVYEGDRGNSGDTLTLGSDAISNALNPVNDVENSSITDLGVAITARTPDYNNTLSLDIDRFDATGLLTNGQTSTTINFKTVGDGYFPGMFTLATNIYAPTLQVTKTVKDLTNGISSTVKPGDVLAYSMALTNIGGDSSTSSILTDAIPAGATYVPGSITINGTSVTDASGDDTGNFTSGTVTARLGTGATASAGGSLAVNATATVAFKVTVTTGDTNGTVIANAATLGYTGATSGLPYVGTSNTVSSTVSVINVNPVLAFQAPPAGEVNVAYTDTLTAAGGTAPYAWTSTATLPPGITLSSTGVLSGTPTASGIYTFTATATDANSQVATETQSIYIAPQPVLAYPTPLQEADQNTAYAYPLGVNPGTGPYVWSVSSGTLPTGMTLNASTGVVSGTPTVQQTANFTVQVVDADGATATEATAITVGPGGPGLNYAAPPAGEATAAYNDQLTETGGISPYLWTISTGSLPAGVTIDSSSGLLSGTPTSAAVGSTTFTVQVADVNGATATEQTTINIIAGPSLTYAAPPSGENGVAYSDTLTATGGTTPYTWSTTGTLPAGLTLSTAGVLSGTPTAAGTSTFMVIATDAGGGTASQSTSVTIVAGPSLTYAAPPSGENGVAYSDTLTATGGTTPYTWSKTGTLPAGLSLSTTGVLSGTPSAAGTSTFFVTATDANGQATTALSTSVTIIAGPSLTYAAPPQGEINTAYTDTLTATGGTTPYTWSKTGTLPAGLSLSSAGVLSGTPTTAGTSTFFVIATDINGQATTARSTSVTIIDGPALTYAAPSQGEVNVAYTDTLTASGGTGPYTWSKTGTLPAGFTLSSTGVLSGTPGAPGTSTFFVTATDANGQATTARSTSVTIVADPSLTFTAPPVETINSGFSDPLTVSNGTAPYMWLVSSGSIPAGVTLGFNSGVLSGTPSVAGTFPFTVEVIDSNGQTATEGTSLTVDPSTALSASATSLTFGTSVMLTATMSPSAASGTVTFTDVLASGPQTGQTVTLGTATLAGGSAVATFTLPAFGTNTVTASYGGDATYAADASGPLGIAVNAYDGEVIVDQFRLSVPGGSNDQYVQLYNTGPAVSLAGFSLLASSGASITVPNTAPVLPTGHSYLLTGGAYSLGAVAASDNSTTSTTNLGYAGVQVIAPDGPATIVDAVGSVGATTGFFSGTALPAFSAAPTGQYAWVRLETAGAPVNTHENAADFKLVSISGGMVGGLQSTLGSPSPLASGSPYQSNGILRSTLLDPTRAANAVPNFVYVRGVSGAPGLVTIRRTVTNISAQTVTVAELRVTSLSEANGVPEPGVTTQPPVPAQLRIIDPATATSTVTVTGRGSLLVENLSVDYPATASPGGGLSTTLSVPLPSGLAAGASINIAITFAADRHGPYWFAYDVDALSASSGGPDVGRALQTLFGTPSRFASQRVRGRGAETQGTLR